MKIECTFVKEHEDGSVTINVDTDKEGTEFLCSIAIQEIFAQAAKATKNNKDLDYKPLKVSVEDLKNELGEAPL